MSILTASEKEFLDVFFHEATNSPFTGPATKALHSIGAWYDDLTWVGWAYNREVGANPDTYTWGHAADVAPPLPWPDRDTVLRRNQEIEGIANPRREPAAATRAS